MNTGSARCPNAYGYFSLYLKHYTPIFVKLFLIVVCCAECQTDSSGMDWNPYCCLLKDHMLSVHCHLPICSGQNLIPEQVEQMIRNTGDQKINFIFTKVPMWKHTAMGIVFKLFGKVLAGTSLFIKIHYFFSRGCAWFHIPLHHNMDVSGYMSAIPPWK